MDGLRGLALLIAITGAVQAGQVYRWTDTEGNVHFGDRPPGAAEPVRIRNAAPEQPAPDQRQREDRTRRLLNAWEEERLLKKEQEAKAREESAQRQRRCVKARNELQDLERGGVFYELDDKGERRYWDDARVQENKQRWQEEVERWCD